MFVKVPIMCDISIMINHQIVRIYILNPSQFSENTLLMYICDKYKQIYG